MCSGCGERVQGLRDEAVSQGHRAAVSGANGGETPSCSRARVIAARRRRGAATAAAGALDMHEPPGDFQKK